MRTNRVSPKSEGSAIRFVVCAIRCESRVFEETYVSSGAAPLPLRLDQAAGGGLDGRLDAGRSAELLARVVDMEIDGPLR